MTTTVSRRQTPITQSQVALHLMINQLSVSTMSAATRKRSFILNEIPAELFVRADAHKLAAILSTLLNSVISESSDSCIRISAKPYGDVVLVHIKDQNRLSGHVFNTCLVQAQQMAEKIGGTVMVNNFRNEATTIAVSFMNTPAAA